MATLAFATPVGAYHDAKEHVVDDTAWTLRGDKRWRLSLFRLDVGLTNRLSLGSHIWPWLARTPNFNLKWRFYAGKRFQWATRFSFFRLDTAAFDPNAEAPPVFTSGSLELLNSWALLRSHQLSQSLVYTAVRASGEVDRGTLEGFGEVGLTNLQYVAAYEWRLSRTLALVVTGRYLLAQVLDGNTSLTLRPDEFTTIEVVGNARDDQIVNFENAFSVASSLAWSWNSLNLRVGLGYGNFNLPGVNFTIDRRVFFPKLDLYWKF